MWKSDPNPSAAIVLLKTSRVKNTAVIWRKAPYKRDPFVFPPGLAQVPQALHIHREEEASTAWKTTKTPHYPPSCSVSLPMSLFKSLSSLRCSINFSTECRTVV